MRFFRRYGREILNDVRLRGRVATVKADLNAYFGLTDIRLRRRGLHGRDNIYLVSSGDNIHGVLRLNNPHKKRPPLPDHMPYRVLGDGRMRIAREWESYSTAAMRNLSPRPLWRAEDAILCEYLPCGTLKAEFEENPDQAWTILLRAARALKQLHDTGLVHMDACLQNMLTDAGGKIFFIDFEYVPAPGLPPAAQRVYDHLRLVETTWKFIPDGKKGDFGGWLAFLSSSLDGDMRRTGLTRLAPALPRILADPALSSQIASLFPAEAGMAVV